MKATINSTVTVPSAYISKNKKRVKQFDDTVYLNNGDEFEIELYNPTQNKILAKIEINGNNIGGSGIILRPGERVFLERYLNEAKKFLFETYTVSGRNSEVQKAIENNGDVSVKFYQEFIPIHTYYGSSLTIGSPTWLSNGNVFYNSGSSTVTTSNYTPLTFTNTVGTTNTSFSNSSVSNTVTTDSFSSNTLRSSTPKMKKLKLDTPKEIETGRIEKGSNSNQSFTYDYTQFNSWNTWKSDWKILPNSQKPVVIEDIKVFCTECGTKRKKDSHKFCPICGTKF